MIEIKLDTRELDRIAAGLDKNVERIVVDYAFQVEARAKQLAPVDTGAMRSSIYTVTQDTDGYSAAAGGAKSQNPAAETEPLPRPSGKTIAIVGPCVDYAYWVEFGSSRMGARPFLLPAIQTIAMLFNSGQVFKDLFK